MKLLVQHEEVDLTRGGHQYPVTTLCSIHYMTRAYILPCDNTIELKRAYATHPLPQEINKSSGLAIVCCFSVRGQKDDTR